MIIDIKKLLKIHHNQYKQVDKIFINNRYFKFLIIYQ